MRASRDGESYTSPPVLVDVVVVHSWDRVFLSQRGVGGAQLRARMFEVVRDFELSPKTEPSSNGSVVGHNECGAHSWIKLCEGIYAMCDFRACAVAQQVGLLGI